MKMTSQFKKGVAAATQMINKKLVARQVNTVTDAVAHLISVDEHRCIGCRQCIKDCPQQNIELNARGKAVIKSQTCIKCGHCQAICPSNAIHISGYSEAPHDITSWERLDSEKLLQAMIARRSVRQFKDEAIAPEIVAQIIEAGRWTPTAKNTQTVRYIVIDKDKRMLEDIALAVVGKLFAGVKLFSKQYREVSLDKDFLFKRAPLAIVVVCQEPVDGGLAASNMALVAEANGLGVLYSGFFTAAIRLSKTLRQQLGIGKGEKAVATLVLGYPAVKYQRSVQRQAANVTYR